MAFEVGERVFAEKSGRRRRTARASRCARRATASSSRVLRGDPNPRYEIRWDEGITTIFSPQTAACTLDPNHVAPDELRRPSAAATRARRRQPSPPNASRTAASAGFGRPAKS